MGETGETIAVAADLLRKGQLVAIPTETVYGLAGNALNPSAVATIFAIKNRPVFNPLIIHADTWEKLQAYVHNVPPLAYRLARRFWPGPLTLLLPRTSRVPDIVTAGLDYVAVRIPQHPLTQQLLAAVDFPLAAPSANPSGYVSPTKASHVAEQLGDKVPYILDGGPCPVGIESTIVGINRNQIIVYRWGGISQEQLQEAAGKGVSILPYRPSETKNPQAPGMLKSHYAPQRRVMVGNLSALLQQHAPQKVAVLSFCTAYPQVPETHQVVLSASGNLSEAAQRLFSALRQLDKLSVTYIIAELVPNEGLGRAINDRLLRAAAEK